jgi:hypothetical protein
MAWIYSTGGINILSGGVSTRKAYSDFVIDLYNGTAPASADAAATGSKLCRITVGSGAVTSTMRSVPQVYTLVAANRTDTNHIHPVITLDGVGPTTNLYTFAAAVDDSDIHAAINIAYWLETLYPALQCTPYAALSVVVQCKIPGLALVMTDGGGTTALTTTEIHAASRASIYTLQFGPPTAGVISKTSDVWSGVGLIAGVAGYGRLVLPTDDGTLSTTAIRAQGAVATSGTEITMSNTTVTVGATSTVDGATITKPTGA